MIILHIQLSRVPRIDLVRELGAAVAFSKMESGALLVAWIQP